MEYIEAFFLAFFGGLATLVLGELVRHFVENPKEEKKEKEATQEAILCLLRSDIVWRCRSLLDRGSASLEDKSIISNEFDAYKKLGGNGFIDKLVPETMKLDGSRKSDSSLRKEV